MTKEEYKEHLCDIIKMVFVAENEVNEQMPSLREKLKEHKVSADEYVGFVADEILSKTPDALIE